MSKTVSIALVDTNILLLIMFASLRRDPAKDTRLSRYSAFDLYVIEGLIINFKSLIVTPNILTEVSNQLKGYDEYQWLRNFIESVVEKFVPSINITKREYFDRLGLTDTILLEKEHGSYCQITDDKDLVNYLHAHGREYIYYNKYRNSYF